MNNGWNDYYAGYQSPPSPFTGVLGRNSDDEFNRTLSKVSEGITHLSEAYIGLTKLTKDLGGPKDSPQLRDNITQKIKSLVASVRDVQNHLHSLDKLAGNSKEKRDRISQISKKFDTVNQKVADICATAKEKIQEVPVHIKLDVDVPESHLYSPPPTMSRDQQQQLLYQQQQFLDLDSQRLEQDDIIEMREREVKRLQGQMIEVHGIFQDIAELVNTSAPLVHDIEANIMESHANVKDATIELKKAEAEQKSSRQKLCWIAFGVAIAICFILIVVVFSTKNT